MIDELRALGIFAKTVEYGSFRAAAKALKLSPSVVSYHISELEHRLGATLLYRSTRQLSLTKEGENLYAAAKTMIEAAEKGLMNITHRSKEPSGSIKITMPAVLTRSLLIKEIARFADAFPKVSIEAIFSDIPQNLIREGIDLAIRIGELKDSSLKAKKLFDMKRTLVVAPSYLANRKPPETPQELMDWDWIGLRMRPNHKVLIDKKGKIFQIHFQPKITVDSVDAVCQFAIAGLGLATPPSFLVEQNISMGELVGLLPDWNIDSLPIYAVWPSNASKESLTFRLMEFLESRISANII